MLWVEISVGHPKIAIGTLYKPPKIPCTIFVHTYDSLVYIYSKYEHAILCGDFNINMLTPDSYEARTLSDNVIDPFDLTQLINTPTRITENSKTLIDLILVNNPKNVLSSGACDVPGISDHFFTYLAYSLKKNKFKPQTFRKRDFRNFDLEGCMNAAEIANWENVFFVNNLDDKVTILENTINDILDKFAPFRNFTIRKPTGTPWITEDIKFKMDERDKLKAAFNATGEKNYHAAYKLLKNEVTSLMRKSQKRFLMILLIVKLRTLKISIMP